MFLKIGLMIVTAQNPKVDMSYLSPLNSSNWDNYGETDTYRALWRGQAVSIGDPDQKKPGPAMMDQFVEPFWEQVDWNTVRGMTPMEAVTYLSNLGF